MHIVSIRAENFKGIKLVEVKPNETTTVVGGRNRAGKSSLLDAIAAALGGAKLCPKKPIREGHDTATCTIELDGDKDRMLPPCTVTRTFFSKNGKVTSQLEIVTKDGYKAPTPQTILDDVVGKLGFDPERFLRMDPRQQAEILRGIVGLDFTKLDHQRQQLYNERTLVNKIGKQLKARFDTLPIHEDAPEKEVSISELIAEKDSMEASNDEVRKLSQDRDRINKSIEESGAAIERLKKAIEDERMAIANFKADLKNVESELGSKKIQDVSEIKAKIVGAEDLNRKVRENQERATLRGDLESEREKSQDLTNRIKEIDEAKSEAIASAKWPVEGLGYDDSGVTINGRPFDQASAAEQREAAFGIVAALNPTLKFAMIKDGSLLDDETLADFARISASRGFQLFVERVGEGEECTVVISDGELKCT